jgi:hypothetical protein
MREGIDGGVRESRGTESRGIELGVVVRICDAHGRIGEGFEVGKRSWFIFAKIRPDA